jgi:hypothetical protein
MRRPSDYENFINNSQKLPQGPPKTQENRPKNAGKAPRARIGDGMAELYPNHRSDEVNAVVDHLDLSDCTVLESEILTWRIVQQKAAPSVPYWA